jgi:CheY-like chemotaxis protein
VSDATRPTDERAPRAFRVLVVDDNEDHRFLTRRAVRSLRDELAIEALTADGGRSALALLLAKEPLSRVDLVLLDLKMHDIDGLEVLRRLRADERARDLRVVLFSSSEHRSDRADALAAGADEYVTKPIAAEAFHACVRDTVRRWARQHVA